jgi:hypothetical protein
MPICRVERQRERGDTYEYQYGVSDWHGKC